MAGIQREWWSHRSGCGAWFLAERDTRTNEVLLTKLPDSGDDALGTGPAPGAAGDAGGLGGTGTR